MDKRTILQCDAALLHTDAVQGPVERHAGAGSGVFFSVETC